MSKQNFYKILDRYLSGTATREEQEFIDTFYDNIQQKKEVSLSDQERAQIKRRLETKIFGETKPKNYKGFKWAAGIAACLALIFTLNLQQLTHSNQNSPSVTYTNIHTEELHKKNIILPDGTKVLLNSNSNLRFKTKFNLHKTRTVELVGEAFFEVKHDTTRPFIVHSKNLKTKVLGTTFNVKTDSLETSVSLIEGSVELQGTNKEKIKLNPLENARLQTGKESIIVSVLDKELELAWMSDTFDFNQTPLYRVIEILQRRYKKKIVLASDHLGKKRVTGFYEKESLETILKSLTLAGKLEYKLLNTNQIVIYEPT